MNHFILNYKCRYRCSKETHRASFQMNRKIEPHRYPSIGLTDFAQAMPDQGKMQGDAVGAGRSPYGSGIP